MEGERKEVTAKELVDLIRSQAGEFIIHAELGEEELHGNTEPVPT